MFYVSVCLFFLPCHCYIWYTFCARSVITYCKKLCIVILSKYKINVGGGKMLGMEILWLAGIVAFIILEAVTYQLISIWFVIGAIGGLIAAMCGVDFYVQMAVFLAISILLLILLRPVSMKLIKKQDFKSNADSLIGKSILVTQEVNNIKGTGQGKVNGMVWTVRSETDETIAAGELAEIKRIEGVKLIVKKQ